MFITKKDGAIGMQLSYRDSDIGIVLLREVYDQPLKIEYVKQKWLAENTTEFKEQDTIYIFKLFIEHMRTYGATDEVLERFEALIPPQLKLDLKTYKKEIQSIYKDFLSASTQRQIAKRVGRFINKKGTDWGSEEVHRQILLSPDENLKGDTDGDTARALIIKYHGKLSDYEIRQKFKKLMKRMPPYDPILFYKQQMEKEGILKDEYK